MVGPLKNSSPGGHTFLLVAVDKFTKWIEAVLVTSVATTCVVNFLRSIISLFGIPHSIITDNGSNFTAEEFQEYCEDLGIQLKYASIAQTQTNGQVKKANGLITSGS
jgi:transposase InsO family protein